MQLQETITPRGKRYYIDGKRVSATDADNLRNSRFRSGCCFQTIIDGETIRHFSIWYWRKAS